MDIIFLIIFVITMMVEEIDNVIMKKVNTKSSKMEETLFESDEDSLLQCAQRCRFIDKDAVIDFRNSRCRCIKYQTDDKLQNHGTLTELFVTQEMKIPEMINVALNKSATQSSTFSSMYPANFAIDGLSNTWTCTNFANSQWWSVDLKHITDIAYMVIRGSSYKDYNKAVIVETRKKQYGLWIKCYETVKIDDYLKFRCMELTSARYLRIRSTVTSFIFIAEFEVYALVIPSTITTKNP